MKRWFEALVVGPQGVLFENNDVQVGCRHAYQGSQARISLFIKNKGAVAVSGLTVDMPEVAYLTVRTQPADPNLAPGASGQHQIAAEAMAPYDVAPEVTITFMAGATRHRYPLRLPSVASCFVEPVPSAAADFTNRWKMLEGQDREQQEVRMGGENGPGAGTGPSPNPNPNSNPNPNPNPQPNSCPGPDT